METLYDILEVSPKASKEVIDKAYKVLVKRYHPDLQTSENKAKAEQMMQKINSAYDTLINDAKRAKYDEELEKKMQEENDLKQKQNDNMNSYNYQRTNAVASDIDESEIRKKIEEKIQKEYMKQYRNHEKNIHEYKRKAKIYDILTFIIFVSVIIIIFGIIWFVPAGRQWLDNLYKDNSIIKIIIDVIKGIFISVIKTIQDLITVKL